MPDGDGVETLLLIIDLSFINLSYKTQELWPIGKLR